MILWEIFEIHIINTLERDDRHNHIISELSKIGISRYRVWRFPCHDKNEVRKALYDNIKTIFEHCSFSKPILLFEDDAMFIKSKLYLLHDIEQFIFRSSYDAWDTIRLGYTKPIYIEQIKDNLYRGNCSYTTGVVYSPTFAKKLLAYLRNTRYNYHILKNNEYLLYDWFLAKISGRCILPIHTILIQGYHGSNNNWNRKYMDEMVNNPLEYHNKYIDIGKRYSLPSHECSAHYIPFCVRYYIMMIRYHALIDIIKGKITYELRNDNLLT